MQKEQQKLADLVKGKKVAFIGAGVSHKTLIEEFVGLGAIVTLCDKKNSVDDFGDYADTIRRLGIRLSLGEHYMDGFQGQDIILRTPGFEYFQKPLQLGADIVTHSSTKYLGGHNDTISGIVVVKDDEEIAEKIHIHIKSHGSQLAPLDSWLILRGIKTLAVRMDRHNENAKKVAEWLRTQPKVQKVYYVGFEDHKDYAVTKKQTTGFGGMISFTVDSFETVKKILKGVDMIMFAESLGGTETLITYPTTQTHEDTPLDIKEKLGITDCFLRMSVGIENADDIIADLDRAMNA